MIPKNKAMLISTIAIFVLVFSLLAFVPGVNAIGAGVCGDGYCEPGEEDCGTCIEDCPCPANYDCSDSQCVPNACYGFVCNDYCTSNTHYYNGNCYISGGEATCYYTPEYCNCGCSGSTCNQNIGDGCCSAGYEDCTTSPSDCPCPSGQVCENHECVDVDAGTCTCEACDGGQYSIITYDGCNSGAGYAPVCGVEGPPYANCRDTLSPAPCTCTIIGSGCGSSADCLTQGSKSGGLPSDDCFSCSYATCAYQSLGTYCTINSFTCNLLGGGAGSCTAYSGQLGGCSGGSYCTCWKGMACESNARCGMCKAAVGTTNDFYCSSGHCCPTRYKWDAYEQVCKEQAECKPDPCPYEPFTWDWFFSVNCILKSSKLACCDYGLMYNILHWYDWKPITIY